MRNPIKRPAALVSGLLFLFMVFPLLDISIQKLYAVPHVEPALARGQRIHGEGVAVGLALSYVGGKRPEREWHL